MISMFTGTCSMLVLMFLVSVKIDSMFIRTCSMCFWLLLKLIRCLLEWVMPKNSPNVGQNQKYVLRSKNVKIENAKDINKKVFVIDRT